MSNYWKKKLEELNGESEKSGNSSNSGNYWQNKMDELEKQEANKKEDIAPVKTSEDEDKKWYQKIFQAPEVFDDGYQFGDVAKTIGGTVGDLGVDLVKGAGKMIEGVTDLAGYGIAGVADLIGQDEFADSYKKELQQSVVDRIAAPVDDFLDDYSVLGETSDAVGEGLGQVAAIILSGGIAGAAGASTAGVSALTTGFIGASSFGSGMGEAYSSGATDGEAVAYGAMKGVIDAGTELLFGGLGKAVNALGVSRGLSSLDDIFARKLSSKFSSQLAKNLVQFGVKSSAEGLEEVIAGGLSAGAKKLTYMSDEDLSALVKDENLMEQFVVGMVTSGISQSGIVPGMKKGSLAEANKKEKDFITGLTKNEQTVLDKVYNDRIAEAEESGKKLTNKEKEKIYDEVKNDLEKGYIDTNTIESVLGGETFKTYQDTITNEDALQKEFDELGELKESDFTVKQRDRYNELKQLLADAKTNNTRANLKTQLSQEVQDLLVRKDNKGNIKNADNYLLQSYNERANRGKAFEADLTQYDTKQQEVVKKAVESGILNNTNRTHEFVDMIAKISADKGVLFDFTNNTKLKDSGFAVDGKSVNGYVTKDGITVNIDSRKSLNSVVGHEIAHVFEGTELNTEMQTAVFEYAKTKNDYQGRYDTLTELYKDIEGANVDAELTADLVGDYLFTDEDFVRNLSAKNRNVFQKIYDEIKYLCKVVTAGSKEARELERVKRSFDKAYKQSGKTSGDTKYSISDSDGKQLTKEQSEYFKDSKMRDENGNLKVMYHGSQDAGFHVFDPAHSDDETSLFFVDRNDVAASYSGTTETYEAQTIRTAEDMNKFIESIGAEGYEVVENNGKFTLLYEGDRVADSNTAKGIYEEFCWYEGVGEGDANYKVYLNLTNPLEIDAKGRPWNKIDAEFSQEVYDRYNSLTAEEKAALTDLAEWEDFRLFNSEIQEAQGNELASAYAKMGEDCNIYDLFSVAADNFSEESMRENARHYLKTRDFAQRAKEQGYDGVIFKNIHDNGGYSNGSEGASTVAIAFDSNQIKSVANEKPTRNADIRYSLAETDAKLKEVGLAYDAKSETVSYSLSSLEDAFNAHTDENGVLLNENDYQKARDEYVNALAKSIAVDKDNPTAEEKRKASKYLDGLFLVHDMIAADKDKLDYEAAVDKSAWVSNSDYGGSIDFSTLCAKRRLFTGTFDAIQNALPDTVLDENDFLKIRDMLLEKELESPCSMCYVEGSRAKHGVYVDKFLKEYLATNPEWKPQIADFTSSTRLERTRIEHPEAYAAYQKAMNKLAQRKPKEASVRTDYKGEILVAFADGSSVEVKNQNGGIRFNSFSDFEIIHALDCMQVLTDMARVGLNGQAYTKVKEFAESFGNTGLKINLSLVAKDVDANGKLVMDEVNGMKYSDAMDIRNKYSDNVGTVIVVFNDAQLKAALADSTIDFVLPFHRSQWKKSQYTMMGLPVVTKDYTAIQNDRIRNPKTGKPVKLSKLKQATTYTNDITGETFVIKDNIMPNMYWDYNKSGRDNANRYLDYINANGMTPKFDFLLDKVDGKWVLPEDAVGDGYFKLLIDFKMYNNEGWGAPQKSVLPEFNMPYIQQMLDNYIGGHQAFPVAHDVVEQFVEGKKNGAFSLSAENNAPAKRYGGLNITGDDVRYEAPMQEDIAPVQEDVANAPISSKMEQVEDYAPISEEEANALQGENIASLTDADAPPEMDAPYYGESKDAEPADPFEDRNIKEVGKRNVKAYMFENPEVKPFFQKEANILLGELYDTQKGERIYTPVEDGVPGTYGAESYGVWTGVSRHTTADIEYLLDACKMSYADIEKGCKAIIEDNGAENIAAAKRIEFVLNDRLMNGYSDITGFEIPADQDYINLLNEKQIREYSAEARNSFFDVADDYAPQEDIAPVAEEITAPIADAPIKEQYEAIRPKRDKNTEPRLKRVKDTEESADGKQRKWVGTSTESEAVDGKILPDDLDQEAIHYQPISNKDTLGKANARLGSMGYESAVTYFNSQFANRKTSVEDIALGERLIQEAIKRGDTKTAGELIQDVSILGTELGQKVQALSIIKRLTPEGQLRLLQRTVERGKTKGDKAFEGVEITQEMIDHILKTYGKDGSYDQKKLNKAVEDVKKQIADQMDVTKWEKANAWRYLSMLGNPKTHIRNLVSNVAMRGTLAVKNAVARTIESVAPIGNRTKTWKAASEDVKAFAQTTAEEMKDILSDGGKYNEEASIKAKREIFKNKVLNGVYNFNSDLLSKEDWWFSRPAFTNALSEYLTANGISTKQDIENNPEIVAKAKQYATEQSQIATFRQYSWLANKINDIENHNKVAGVAVGAVLPFKKTPINIAKTALNYSPVGFAKTLTYDISQVKNGKMEASQLVDNLSQNITGSALTLVGYLLASAGFINGAGEDDKEGEYDYQLGEQSYSINIGDSTYSLSWLSPIAMPLFVGANAYEQLVEGKEWNGDVVMETLAQTLDPLSEMSFLSSLDSVLSSYDSGVQKFAGIAQSAAQNYITQFAPTLGSQVAAVLDDTKRTTKVASDSGFKFVDETINNLKYKIPFLRETLEPTTDIWGNEVKQTENVIARAFETFIAPYSRREDITTKLDNEIKELYRQTGDDGVIPSIPNNSINYNGEKYTMSAKEYTEYKQIYGQTAYDLMERLIATDTYQYADSETRAELMNKVYDYARDEAKREFFANRDVDFTNATSEGEEYYKENAIFGAIENDMLPDEYTFSQEYPEKYKFLNDNGVTYEDYQNGSDEFREAYSWAYKNPEKFTVSKAVAGDVVEYRKYAGELYDIKADKDEDGKSITGSRKEKVIDYVNSLDIDYGARLILFKNEYNADDTYNYDIIDYLNSRDDISYEEMETILKELGFTVKADGSITWD